MPAETARLLRQEAGFGCAQCGHPYIEYHHIIPWAKEQHFRPEDMMSLCGNCHPAVAKYSWDRQREIKAAPFNKEHGRFAGALCYDKTDLVFKVGGNWYENTPVILQYKSAPIISCQLKDGQAQISMNLFDREGQQVMSVIDNEMDFRLDDVWDFEYGHNWAIARSGPRKIALKLDFSGQEAIVEGALWLGGAAVTLGRDHTSVGGSRMFDNTFSGCAAALSIQ